MFIAARFAAFCLLAATPLTATLVTVSFNGYCDQLSGNCGSSSDSYRFPIVGTTTVSFDDGIIRETSLGPVSFLNFGVPFIDSTFTETMPLPVPAEHPSAVATLRIQAAAASLDDADSLSHQISFTAPAFDIPVDPNTVYDLLLSSTLPFLSNESEAASVRFPVDWSTTTGQYSGFAYLVGLHGLGRFRFAITDTPEPATFGILALGLLISLRIRRT